MFKDKVLLITGGTGSFGNAMLKGFLNSEFNDTKKIELNIKQIRFWICD